VLIRRRRIPRYRYTILSTLEGLCPNALAPTGEHVTLARRVVDYARLLLQAAEPRLDRLDVLMLSSPVVPEVHGSRLLVRIDGQPALTGDSPPADAAKTGVSLSIERPHVSARPLILLPQNSSARKLRLPMSYDVSNAG
jgi:hypothetical protein